MKKLIWDWWWQILSWVRLNPRSVDTDKGLKSKTFLIANENFSSNFKRCRVGNNLGEICFSAKKRPEIEPWNDTGNAWEGRVFGNFWHKGGVNPRDKIGS